MNNINLKLLNNKKNFNLLVIFTGLLFICINNVLGHYYPPFSILWTPIILTFITTVINYPLYKVSFNETIIYNYFLILFNDVFMRINAGGDHDEKGKVVIFFASAVSFFITAAVIFIYSLYLENREKNEETIKLSIFKTTLISSIVCILIYIFFISNI